MGEWCEVLVVGAGEAAETVAGELARHGVDVRLTEPDVEITELEQDADGIRAVLRDPWGDTLVQLSKYVVRSGSIERDARLFAVREKTHAENLAWKLAAVLHGAGETLLDSYLAECDKSKYKGYRESRLSQELGGKRVKIRAGERVPDITLWAPPDGPEGVASSDVKLRTIAQGPHWLVLGLGVLSAETVSALGHRFGSSVRGHVLGGGSGMPAGVTLLDRYGEAARRLGGRGGTILVVRPDGHLGLRCGPNIEVIVAYLEDLVPVGGND